MALTEKQRQRVDTIVAQYKAKEAASKKPWMSSLREVMNQHIDMAQGGNGGSSGSGLSGERSIRAKYYPGAPNEFFQFLCNKMGWNWRGGLDMVI